MTHAELKTLASLYLNDPNRDVFTAANLTLLLNAAQARIADIIEDTDESYFSGIETFAVSVDDDAWELTLPADCMKVLLVEKVADPPIPYDYIDFRRRHAESPATIFEGTTRIQTKLFYYLRGGKLGVVAPSEAHTIRVWYVRRLTDLSADGDTSEIPANFHELLALEAAKRACGSVNKDFPKELADLHGARLLELNAYVHNRARQGAKYVIPTE